MLTNERVEPNQLCKNCERFWTSATCLKQGYVDLVRQSNTLPGRDNHIYQTTSAQKSTDFLELYRDVLYHAETDLYQGSAQKCHSCALIQSYYSQNTTQATHFRRSPRLVTKAYPYGTIVGSIVLETSLKLLNEGATYRISLFCSLSCAGDDTGPDYDWFRVCGPNLVLYHDDDIDGPPAISDDQSVWSTSTASDKCRDLILDWMRRCYDSCPQQCSADWSSTPIDTLSSSSKNDIAYGQAAMPTRLLDISILQDQHMIRVVSSADNATTVEYLTLSYTWGGIEPFKLTRENYKDCLKGFNIGQLPRVCQQAVELTRKLGFRYLWIDAVCIVQNDQQDWMYESVRMDSIFAGSTLTLAASSTRTCNDQLYCTRNPLAIFQLSLQCLRIGYKLVPAICSTPAYPPPPMIFGPRARTLDSRGWVYQERALSPRTVHFTASRLHWECRSCNYCESSPRHATKTCRLFEQGSAKQLLGSLIDPIITSHDHTYPREIYQDGEDTEPRMLWAKLCSNYGSTALTHWTDRYRALAGLLRFLESSLDLTLRHGFCAEYGVLGLLWYVHYPNQTVRDPDVPSWSYMCLRPRTTATYNISCRHLLAARHTLPQSMRAEIVQVVQEVANLHKILPLGAKILHINLPLIRFVDLLKGFVKKSATQWLPVVQEQTQVTSVHCFSEAGYTLYEDFSKATYMTEIFCGIIYQGRDFGELICYCLLVRQIASSTNHECERIGVAEVDFARHEHPSWPRTQIKLL